MDSSLDLTTLVTTGFFQSHPIEVQKAAIVEAARRLGYQLKKEQYEVISSFIQGSDVMAVLPTGFGKSLCYACLPFIFDALLPGNHHIIIILTPLTAIMKDQASAFRLKGLTAGYICGEKDDEEMKQNAINAKYQLLFFIPEALLGNKKWRRLICSDKYRNQVKGLILDEAHTIKKWGTTFREVLLKVGELRSLIPEEIPVMALTATATRSLQEELSTIIGLKSPVRVILPPCKSNLTYRVLSYESFEESFTPLLIKLRQERVLFPRTIIYCRKMDDCANLYLFFKNGLGKDFTQPPGAPSLSQFRLVNMFTSCTDTEVKDQIITVFSMKGSTLRIVCATIAFGMGIDCPDVRTVIHYGPPDDLESYIQETGRAGRDGLPSEAILLVKNKFLVFANKQMKHYCMTSNECRRDLLFSTMEGYNRDLCRVSDSDCCDVCQDSRKE